MNQSKRIKFILTISLLVTILLCFFVYARWFSPSVGNKGVSQLNNLWSQKTDTIPPGNNLQRQKETGFLNQNTLPGTTRNGSLEQPPSDSERSFKKDELDLVSVRYLEPEMQGDNRYAFQEPKTNFSRSCLGKRHRDEPYFTNLIKELQMDSQNRYPMGVSFQSLAQFWSRDSVYFQLSARAELSEPPKYEIIYAKSSRADFLSDVERLPLEGYVSGSVVSALRVYELFASELNKERKKGAQEGARIMSVSQLDVHQQPHEFTFLNAVPVGYMGRGMMCVSNSSGNLDCHCSFAKEPERLVP